MGPFLFLIHINDLPETLSKSAKLLFAVFSTYKSLAHFLLEIIKDCKRAKVTKILGMKTVIFRSTAANEKRMFINIFSRVGTHAIIFTLVRFLT